MKPKKEKISITIDPGVLEELRVMAEEDDRPLSQYINLVLRTWIETGGFQNQPVERQKRQ